MHHALLVAKSPGRAAVHGPDDGLEEWDNELEKTLKNQESTYVEFDDDDEGCVWNIKVLWADYD